MWLTRANALTGLRFAAALPLACAIAAGHPGLAAALFALAVGTDLLDGRVARRFGEASPLGGLLDHAADATTAVCGLAALAWQGAVPVALPALVAAAFAQYALDSGALAGRRLRASALGRANGIAYFALLGTPLVRDALGLAFPGAGLVRALGWTLVATTLLSVADRAAASLRWRGAAGS
ncbi:MAG TPA: CDP-alcohol phosphatidyltransferase family protein [Myxococcota bacterium]|jgi:cardiolipin synthase|nr:CDP-alcohol phosphatidyltransferase family protein [Myxococcota bacterium]